MAPRPKWGAAKDRCQLQQRTSDKSEPLYGEVASASGTSPPNEASLVAGVPDDAALRPPELMLREVSTPGLTDGAGEAEVLRQGACSVEAGDPSVLLTGDGARSRNEELELESLVLIGGTANVITSVFSHTAVTYICSCSLDKKMVLACPRRRRDALQALCPSGMAEV